MNLFRTRYGAVALCVAAVAAAGCGSSSKSKSTPAGPAASTPATPSTPSTPSTGTTTTPTGGFSAELNALCKATNAKATKINTSDMASIAAFIDQELPKFKALTPPASNKAAFDKFIAAAEAEAKAFKAGDQKAGEAAAASGKQAAKTLGAPACEE